MFLSIIIPIWNDEKFLAECLNSCLTQDIPYDDYEIICVDDGSTDRTPDILADYAKKYPNVVVINKEHGVGFGRNIGMDHAKGEYLWFVDHDDLVEENCLAYLKGKIEETGCERLVFPYYIFYDAFTHDELQLKAKKQLPVINNEYIDLVVWTSLVSRAFLDKNNIWPHSLVLGDRKAGLGVDSFFVLECRMEDVKEVRLEERPFYYYRQHAGQDTKNVSPEAKNKQAESVYSIALAHADHARIYKDLYEKEKSANGRASIETTRKMIMWTRSAGSAFATQGRDKFRNGIEYMKKLGVFWKKTPEEYKSICSCKDYIKGKHTNGIIRSVLCYYSFIPTFLYLYKITDYKHYLHVLKEKSRKSGWLKKLKNKLCGR